MPAPLVPWAASWPGYAPPYHVDPEVLARDRTRDPRGWADPEDVARVGRPFRSFTGAVAVDAAGRPRHPRGRTGLAGRGLLGNWGANFAADPVVTRARAGRLEVLLVVRRDSGLWALPGGMADPGEAVTRTLARELEEEAGVRLDFAGAREVWRGLVDDPRNTDHAWMETVVRHLHLGGGGSARPRAGSDARAARWRPVEEALAGPLWADHRRLLQEALRSL